jgi:GNAT superfamily N-acetyltransferase
MNIRLATAKDKKQALSLLDEMSKLFKANDVPSQVGGAIYDEVINRNDTKIFVAEENNELLGLATFYLLPNIRHGWHRGHIEDIYVAKKMRGKGVGSLIFSAIKDYCKSHQIKVIKLDSDIKLKDAHKFYKKNGGKFTEKMFRFDIK